MNSASKKPAAPNAKPTGICPCCHRRVAIRRDEIATRFSGRPVWHVLPHAEIRRSACRGNYPAARVNPRSVKP